MVTVEWGTVRRFNFLRFAMIRQNRLHVYDNKPDRDETGCVTETVIRVMVYPRAARARRDASPTRRRLSMHRRSRGRALATRIPELTSS